ncbi:MAG TPA: glycoside hydrolase family 3 protein [Thermoanaerobaculia bacterium]|nr:glycoside hydrolase family 3 protein [Thermoanaerobaculia bacterium]
MSFPVRSSVCVLTLMAARVAFGFQSVDETIAAMSDAEKIAQLLFVGFDGRTMNRDLTNLVKARRVGGIVLYAENLQSPEQVRRLTRAIREEGAALPPFIAVDQEGGVVRRLGGDFPVVPSAMSIGATCSSDVAFRAGYAVGSGLSSLGFTMNFAPVLDLLSEPENTSLGTRAFGDDPHLAASLGAAFIAGHEAAGVISVPKHFPGGGGAADDPHHALPSVMIDAETLRRRELVPFRHVIEEGVRALLSSHAAFPRITGSNVSATLSPVIMTNLLREELGFEGVAISDALQMKALDQSRGAGPLALQAILSGSDMVLALGDVHAREAVFRYLQQAYADGRLPKARLEASLRRILALKRLSAAFAAVPPDGNSIGEEIARRAVTVVGRASLLPVATETRTLYIGPEGNLLRRLQPTHRVVLPRKPSLVQAQNALVTTRAAAREARVIIAAATNREQYDLIRRLHTETPSVPFVFVNLGSPHRIIRGRSACTILTYGDDAASQNAALDVVRGELQASGTLPIALPDEP